MKVHITLEQNFGHPDNRPDKEAVLKMMAEQLSKAINDAKHKERLSLEHWQITKIEVE